MNKAQFSSLNKSLKKSFSGVSNDITKLNKKNYLLNEELLKLHEKSNLKIAKDEFYRIIKKIDEDMKEFVHQDLIKSTEARIKQRAEELIEIPNNNIYKLDKKLDDVKKEIKKADKENSTLVKEIRADFSKTENLKREVREVSKLKKSLLNQDNKYALKSKVDNCFEEIDEVYDLIEELEAKTINSVELEKFKKELTSKIKKFEGRIADAEDIEAELTKKIKDIYSVDKKVEVVKKEITNLKRQIKTVDNSAKIEKVNIELLKEVSTLDTRIIKQNEVIKNLNNKLNDVITLFNKQSTEQGSGFKLRKMYESKLTEEDEKVSKNIKSKVKRAEASKSSSSKTPQAKTVKSKPVPAKKLAKTKTDDSILPEGEPKKSIWIKVLDWFTEEVDEEEDEE